MTGSRLENMVDDIMNGKINLDSNGLRRPQKHQTTNRRKYHGLINHPIDGHLTDRKWAEDDLYREGWNDAEDDRPFRPNSYYGRFRRAYILGYKAYSDSEEDLEDSLAWDL